MKKVSYLLIVLFMVTGCAMFQLTDSQEVVSSILARRVGHTLATSHTIMADRAVPIAVAFVNGTGTVAMVDTFASILLHELEDPLLREDISDLLKLVHIEGSVVTDEEMQTIEIIMKAFLQGIRMGGVK